MAPSGQREPLFEVPSEYEALLGRGIRLSGEDRTFFVRGRVADLVAHVPPGFHPHRVLDFGCGVGDTSAAFAAAFPDATVLGVDSSPEAVAWAREHHGDGRTRFDTVDAIAGQTFDLCYLAGVLHHVRPEARGGVLESLRSVLAPRGFVAVFENNPWNPGTRMVMRRIPFDRDAVPVPPPEAARLLEAAGFACVSTRFLFYFPRVLRVLRPLEPMLAGVPLGAQYWVLAQRP
jgi:SAM-dependent methyltransferase